jgi:hypothetical protein
MEPINEGNLVSDDFDLCFRGINLSGALLALAALKSGLKVAIKLDRPLNWEFEPELVTMFPLQWSQLIKSRRQIRFFEKISKLFPSLVYPQRILTVSDGKKFNSKTFLLFDFLLNRDREIASLPINFSKYPSLIAFGNHFQNGLLVHEFRFDRKRAIIVLLQKCRELGAFISDKNIETHLPGGPKLVFNCLPYEFKKSELKINNYQFSFKNNMRIITRDFEMTAQTRESDSVLKFRIKNSQGFRAIPLKVFQLMKATGIEWPEKFEKELMSIFTILPDTKPVDQGSISDPEIFCLKQGCQRTGKIISNAMGKNLGFGKMIKTLKDNNFNGSKFRLLQAECDEKFDLSKQTGIDYEKFSYYFFRYRDDIDELIELAYQQLHLNKKYPHLLWQNVEAEFQKKIEEAIFR